MFGSHRTRIVFTAALLAAAPAAMAQSGTYALRHLTPETAIKAVQAALAECRKRGYQASVAVVDRSGVVQALMRDRYAGPHTPETAIGKAYTAISFRTDTLDLSKSTEAGQPHSGVRHLRGIVNIGGGMMIQAGGSIVGGIGVSGAPGGEADEACAKAGIAAIRDDLDF